eukprot:3730608-Amphidinium_carterae.8
MDIVFDNMMFEFSYVAGMPPDPWDHGLRNTVRDGGCEGLVTVKVLTVLSNPASGNQRATSAMLLVLSQYIEGGGACWTPWSRMRGAGHWRGMTEAH